MKILLYRDSWHTLISNAARLGYRALLIRIILLATLAMLLHACGGSSSEPNTLPDPSDDSETLDTTIPVITLIGSDTETIIQGSAHTDKGATAVDNLDGDITNNIVVTNDLDTNTPGTYYFYYNATDSANNRATELIREVSVVSLQQELTFFGATEAITIGAGMGGFDGVLDSGDRFGRDHATIGDINGDGIDDLLIGARSDDDGEVDAGAVYVLMMNQDGSVNTYQKISQLEGGFSDTLLPGSFFGYGVAGIGDIDNDGVPDIAVSASSSVGHALYTLHLNSNGSVKSWVKIEGLVAQGLTAIGDIDNDGIIDLIAANPLSDDGGSSRGAIDIVFLDQDSTLRNRVTISSTQGGFGEGLNDDDQFGGRESAMLGDIDGDGTLEVAVGAFMSDGGRGAIWILSLNTETFNVESKTKIASMQGGFNEELPDTVNTNGSFGGQFGHALAYVGDLNGDGIGDLVTAANQYDEGYAYLLFLDTDKSVKTFTRINNSEGGFDLSLEESGRFGRSISFYSNDAEDDAITINLGGGAGSTGTIYSLQYEACEVSVVPGNYFWQSDATLFSNWDHASQIVDEPLTLEQCLQKSVEFESHNVTHNSTDLRCIIQASDAELIESIEGSRSYVTACFE